MNKKKLYQKLTELDLVLSRGEIPLIHEALDLFSPVVEELKINPGALLSNADEGRNKRNSLNNQLNQIISTEKKLPYRKLIIQSSKLDDGLGDILNFLGESNVYYSDFLNEIRNKLEEFLISHESHTRKYTPLTCLSVSLAASDLKAAITSTTQVIGGILSLSDGIEIEGANRLDLYLSNVNTLKQFSIKLGALAEIYSELLVLYDESEIDFPIVIEQLESGSLWIKVVGHSLTATILTAMLATATDYYQTEFTKTGQIKQLPTSVKVVDDLLQITAQLEKDGIDTSEIKDNIVSATKKISRNLNVLLADQPIVEINNDEKNGSSPLC